MKNKAIYILIAVILSSCGMSNNFNSQKFTSLKKIKPIKTEQVLVEDDLAQTSAESNEEDAYQEEGISEHSPYFETSATIESLTESDNVFTNNEVVQNSFNKPKTLSSPIKKNIQLEDKQPDTEEEEKKEDNMFIWMMVMFILAAPASIFLVVPAIPFYLTAFILAILLLRRINKIPYKKRSRKQNIRRGLAIWVLVQWALGLALVGILILYI